MSGQTHVRFWMKKAAMRAKLASDRGFVRKGCTEIGQSAVDGRHELENKTSVTSQKLLTEEIVGSKNPSSRIP